MGWIKNRIDAEYRKHKTLDWSGFAEAKIRATIKEKLKTRFHMKDKYIEEVIGKD